MNDGSVAIALPADPDRARVVITRGRRIARSLGVDWVAVRIDAWDKPRHDLFQLVTALGGRLLSMRASDVAGALVELTRREHARVLVIGRSRRPRFLRRLKRGITERILNAQRSFDVVIAAEGADR